MRNELLDLLKESTSELEKEVILEALDNEDPKAWFEDLLQYGCQS
jgi:hypothetical protein